MGLWAGEGDLSTPGFIVEAAAKALAAGETFYTWQRGIPELRQALARYHEGQFGRRFSAEEFFVTGSGMQAIQIALAMTAEAGSEVIIPTPAWPNAAAAAGIAGAHPVEVPMRFGNDGWTLDLESIAAAVTDKTKVLVIVSPSNPTGWTATQDELKEILALARRHGLWIVADETYSRFWYGAGRTRAFLLRRDGAGRSHRLRQHLLEKLGDDRLAHGMDLSASLARTGGRESHPVFDLGRRAIHAAGGYRGARARRGLRAATDCPRPQESRHRLRHSRTHRPLPLRGSARRLLSVLFGRRRNRHICVGASAGRRGAGRACARHRLRQRRRDFPAPVLRARSEPDRRGLPPNCEGV